MHTTPRGCQVQVVGLTPSMPTICRPNYLIPIIYIIYEMWSQLRTSGGQKLRARWMVQVYNINPSYCIAFGKPTSHREVAPRVLSMSLWLDSRLLHGRGHGGSGEWFPQDVRARWKSESGAEDKRRRKRRLKRRRKRRRKTRRRRRRRKRRRGRRRNEDRAV